MEKLRKERLLAFLLTVLAGVLSVALAAWATSVGTNVSVSGTLTATGNTGVGTSTPATLLAVHGGFYAAGPGTFSGALTATSTFTLGGNITLNPTATTTVTFSGTGGINFDSDTFVIDPNANRIGIGTSSPSVLLAVHGSSLLGNADADTLTVRAGTWSISTTATTTVAMTNGLNFDSNTFVIDPNANRVGVGTNAPKTTFEVSGTASTTNLVVGGNGSTLAGVIFGFCNISSGTITASTTKAVNCTSATGVRTGDRVFVMATSSLPTNLILLSASSSAGDTISLYVHRLDVVGGASATDQISVNFFSVR